MSRLRCSVLLLAACDVPALTYDYGHDLTALTFNLHSDSVGVYPSQDVLDDPNNPFAEGGLAGESRWDIQSSDLSVAAYYAWATWLTQEPTGEAQYYTASNLKQIYQRGMADSDDLYYVRALAIAGFTVQLETFPDAVTYDVSGTIAYELSPLSYAAILELGGVPPAGWTSFTDPDGNLVLVRTGGE